MEVPFEKTKKTTEKIYREAEPNQDINILKSYTLDDMESFIANILIGDVKEEDKYTFFLPKLSEEEIRLIEDQDIEYLNSFACYIKHLKNPDVKYDESLSLETDGWVLFSHVLELMRNGITGI